MAFASAAGHIPKLVDLTRQLTVSGMVGAAAMVQHSMQRAARAARRRAAAGVAAMEDAAAASLQRAAEALESVATPADGVKILPGPSMVKLMFEVCGCLHAAGSGLNSHACMGCVPSQLGR